MAQHTTNYNLEKQQGNDLVNINGINNNFDIIDTEINEAQNRMQKAIGTLSELKAVTGVPENTTILCKGLGLYRYDASSAAAPDDFFIVAPSLGAGRWILMAETAMGFSADTGSTNAYVLTLPGLSAYYTGMMVWFKPVNGNTGACTINVNTLGAKSLVRPGGVALTSGDITAGALICAVYDGTNFQLISLLAANLVHLTATQTLTNKTLTSPILTTPKFATAGYITDANGNELIRFPSTVASAVNEITVNNAATGVPPSIQSSGSDTNVGLDIKSKGTGTIRNYVNNVVSVVFDAAASAVNSLTMKSNATNNSPSIEAAGSDTNVGIDVKTKGTGVFRTLVNGVVTFVVDTVAGAVNYLTVKANTTGNAPAIMATGNDTNIDVNVVPKGTGRLTEKGIAVIRQGEDYRPNLLPNGDFQLWSGGLSFSFPTDGALTADKWKIWHYIDSNIKVYKSGRALRIEEYNAVGGTGAYTSLYQDVEDWIAYAGKTITFSSNILIDSSVTAEISLYDGINSSSSGMISSSGTKAVTATISSNLTQLQLIISIYRNGVAIGKGACINWAKLEVNDHATPFIPKSYKEEVLNCSENIGYAPNLLINGDFQVWQRGTSFDRTGIAGRFYGPDRWCIFRGGYSAGAIATRDGEYLKLYNPYDGVPQVLTQSIELANVKKLRGKTITFSIRAKSASALNAILNVYYKNDMEYIPGVSAMTICTKTVTLGTSFAIYDVTGVVPVDAVGLAVELYVGVNGATIWFEYAKLEVNDHATPFIPKSYGEELALCQRYYQTLYLANGALTNGRITIYTALPTVMRIIPTKTLSAWSQNAGATPTTEYTQVGVDYIYIGGQGGISTALYALAVYLDAEI